MVPLRNCPASLCVVLVLALNITVAAQSPQLGSTTASAKSLFNQSAVHILDREFADPDISYLLFDAQTGALLASRWENPEKPIPVGSLVKPFTALAYAEQHNFQYPSYVCRGERTGCWQKRPHGKLDIVAAIAQSCNSYFRSMAAALDGEQLDPVAARFGLDLPDTNLTGAPLMGLGDSWRIAPLHIAHAYV